MDRRTFLKVSAGAGALAATSGLATPAISQGAAAKTLRFVPQANLANFDPIWGHAICRAQRLGDVGYSSLRRR